MTTTPTARIVAIAIACLFAAVPSHAAQPKEPARDLDVKEFFAPELAITTSHAELGQALPTLRNREAWEAFLAGPRQGFANGSDISVWIDPRSGTAVNILGAYPLIPGNGFGNAVSLRSLGAGAVNAAVVDAAVRRFVDAHARILGHRGRAAGRGARHPGQRRPLAGLHSPGLRRRAGAPRRAGGQHQPRQPGHHRHRHLGQRLRPLRAGRTSRPRPRSTPASRTRTAPPRRTCSWSRPASRSCPPRPSSQERRRGRRRPGIRPSPGVDVRVPAPARRRPLGSHGRRPQRRGARHAGHQPLRAAPGHGRRLPGDQHRDLPDAPDKCGTMQTGWPMPFANTGLASPNNFANSAGIFDWTSGNVDHHARPAATSTSSTPAARSAPLGDRQHRHGRHQRPARLHDARRRRRRQHRRPRAPPIYEVNKIEPRWRAAGCPTTPGCTGPRC